MKKLLLPLLLGQSLRHRPIALRRGERHPVRAIASGQAWERDVTAQLFPMSLNPLILGLAGESTAPRSIRMEDPASGKRLGTIVTAPHGQIDHPGGRLALLRPTICSVSCVPEHLLMWRYALAWRQARRSLRDPNAFHMSFADLRALNVFYMLPRPVYLISVVHEDASNIFPMDLVGPLGDDLFVLALRRTSPSVELMRQSGQIVAAGAPASMKREVYSLGIHHKRSSVDWNALPLSVQPSPLFGIPTPSQGLGVRELEIVHSEPIGSHMLFVTSVARKSGDVDEPQLAHVSDMYARWSARHGRPFDNA
jgi:flavin reductase (DIM6/NTAB) family NADH-FMN oxidoreductase RutF